MKVFELHFNPKVKEDLLFDSFCYEPENIYERRLGSLYIVGELKNVLPKNLRLLDKTSQLIKGKYYAYYLKSPEVALRESLKAANDFLAEEVKKENVSWLGNLSLAVLSFKNFELNFSKVEDIKILLLRGGKITEIGKNLDLEGIEPYPLKVFGNIASGKLIEGDVILILNKEVFELFSHQNLLNELAQIIPFDEKRLRGVLRAKRNELLKISGICLLMAATKIIQPAETLTFQKELEKFSFSQIFSPLLNFFQKLTFRPKIKIPKISLKLPAIPKIKFSPNLNRKLMPVLLLIFFLLLGYFIFR